MGFISYRVSDRSGVMARQYFNCCSIVVHMPSGTRHLPRTGTQRSFLNTLPSFMTKGIFPGSPT
jgi:hypothetical protein